ncbi:hypothetical protein Tco_0185068 [Tanacetum coccineum]
MIDHVDAFDLDCDDAPTTSAIFMARLSPTGSVTRDDVCPFYDTNILSEVPNYDNYHDNDMFHLFIQELENFEQSISINDMNVELPNDNNVIFDIPYANTNKNKVVQDMTSLAQTDVVILSVIENMQHEVTRCNTVNQETKQVNESLTVELERYKEKVKLLETQKEPQLVFTSREKNLDSQLQKQIIDHNEKADDFQKEIFTLKQELSLKVETNSFLKNNLEVLKKESSEREDKYIDEVLVLNKKRNWKTLFIK